MGLIIPKCNADPQTLDLTLKVYYDANDWVENDVLINSLSKLLQEEGIEDKKKEPQSYTKKTQVLSYYGLLEWEDITNNQSRRRITDNGKKLYKYRRDGKTEELLTLLLEILRTNTFGRNVLGCNSDSDLEAPNIFVKSCLIIKDLTNKEFGYILGKMEYNNMELADALLNVVVQRIKGEQVELDSASAKWSDPKPILALADWGLFDVTKNGNSKFYNISKDVLNNHIDDLISLRTKNTEEVRFSIPPQIDKTNTTLEDNDYFHPYITAIKTKPFLLLAGISGTGKSRIVRELAFKSCPSYLQDTTGTTPGNYCMIEVKPNWHDSTELLGYYSRLGKPSYQFTKFIKFLVKAKMFPEVPFFICLDEMNLAPVEQYFAEILSILETRKHINENGIIKTEAIIDASYFRDMSVINNVKNAQTGECFNQNLTDRDIYMKLFGIDRENNIKDEIGNKHELTTEGLTLPQNVILIGTVNMDDTTHKFSRKVIDRAMTIEMNGGNLRDMFGGSKNLSYLSLEEQEKWQKVFSVQYVTADEVLDAHPEVADNLIKQLPERLDKINQALKGTPFEVSYRVLNELTIMVGVMLDENKYESLDIIINHALNYILLMKILPRIEGDTEMFSLSRDYKNKMNIPYDNRLEWLKDLAPDIHEISSETTLDSSDTGENINTNIEYKQTAKEKIQEMIDRLNNQEFTRFWP